MEIILTGTGGAEPLYLSPKGKKFSNFRKNPDALVIVKSGNKKFFIKLDYNEHSDIGLLESGFQLSVIDLLLISHAHEDHLNYRFFASKIGDCAPHFDSDFIKKPVSVCAPKPVIETIVELLERKNFYPTKESRKKRINIVFRSIQYRKEVLFLNEIKNGDIIKPLPNLEIKFISAPHPYRCAYSVKGKGRRSIGIIISQKDIKKSFLYLTDFADFNQKEEKKFEKNISSYNLDLLILGMPVPFSENKTTAKHHMILSRVLSLIRKMKNHKTIKPKAKVILTHITDRYLSPDYKKRIEQTTKKYSEKIIIPPHDGFRIQLEKEIILKR